MRWKTPESMVGQTRTIRVFLFLPRTINNETRWLEWAKIRQMYFFSNRLGYGYWSDEAWEDR